MPTPDQRPARAGRRPVQDPGQVRWRGRRRRRCAVDTGMPDHRHAASTSSADAGGQRIRHRQRQKARDVATPTPARAWIRARRSVAAQQHSGRRESRRRSSDTRAVDPVTPQQTGQARSTRRPTAIRRFPASRKLNGSAPMSWPSPMPMTGRPPAPQRWCALRPCRHRREEKSSPLDQIPLRRLHQCPDGQAMRLCEMPAHREPLPMPQRRAHATRACPPRRAPSRARAAIAAAPRRRHRRRFDGHGECGDRVRSDRNYHQDVQCPPSARRLRRRGARRPELLRRSRQSPPPSPRDHDPDSHGPQPAPSPAHRADRATPRPGALSAASSATDRATGVVADGRGVVTSARASAGPQRSRPPPHAHELAQGRPGPRSEPCPRRHAVTVRTRHRLPCSSTAIS